MANLVIDLEATCGFPAQAEESEIIEIGLVVTTPAWDIILEKSFFVKPIINPVLTGFCKKLTSIQQEDVDKAKIYPEVMAELTVLLSGLFPNTKVSDHAFCSWGNYDRNQFVKDSILHGIPYPFGEHRNLKNEFAKKLELKKKKGIGLSAAVSLVNLEFEGTHHRGIDDARNVAKIAKKTGL